MNCKSQPVTLIMKFQNSKDKEKNLKKKKEKREKEVIYKKESEGMKLLNS